MQENIMIWVIKLHALGRKLIDCRGQEGNSLLYSPSSHNGLFCYTKVHFSLEKLFLPTSGGKIQAIWTCGLSLYDQLDVHLVYYWLQSTAWDFGLDSLYHTTRQETRWSLWHVYIYAVFMKNSVLFHVLSWQNRTIMHCKLQQSRTEILNIVHLESIQEFYSRQRVTIFPNCQNGTISSILWLIPPMRMCSWTCLAVFKLWSQLNMPESKARENLGEGDYLCKKQDVWSP